VGFKKVRNAMAHKPREGRHREIIFQNLELGAL